MVGHTFEYAPAVGYIHKLIESGAIGETLHIRSQRVNLGQHQTHINVLWDLAPHDISIISFLLGKSPTHVSAIGRSHVNPRINDIVSLTLEYENDLMANVILSWLDPRKSREMTIIGSKKMLVYDDTISTEKIRIFDKGAYGPNEYRSFGEFQVSYRYGDMVSPHLENYEPLREQSDHFVECIRTGKTPRSDGESGARVVRVLSAAQLSLDEGGQRIAVSDRRVELVEGSILLENAETP
jgi:predicted dehydrogenase